MSTGTGTLVRVSCHIQIWNLSSDLSSLLVTRALFVMSSRRGSGVVWRVAEAVAVPDGPHPDDRTLCVLGTLDTTVTTPDELRSALDAALGTTRVGDVSADGALVLLCGGALNLN
jgi:hypothetical protein